jgi:hypothetical protein
VTSRHAKVDAIVSRDVSEISAGGMPTCCEHIRPVEADVPSRAQCDVAVAAGGVQELCGERGRRAVHVGAATVSWAGAQSQMELGGMRFGERAGGPNG